MSHKTLYKEEVIHVNKFIYFYKQDLNGIYYCTFGILLGSYTRNEFELTDSLFLGPSDISIENFISLRHAVKVDSLFEGQGFLKCALEKG
jgi:hypothetical protein